MPADLHAKFKHLSYMVSLEQLPAVVQYYCQPPESRAFSSDSTTNRTPQCRAFSRALKTEMLNVPLFSGPRGAVDTNDWCIINFHSSESLVYSCMRRLSSVFISKAPRQNIQVILSSIKF